jgi:hypothetical protein
MSAFDLYYDLKNLINQLNNKRDLEARQSTFEGEMKWRNPNENSFSYSKVFGENIVCPSLMNILPLVQEIWSRQYVFHHER